MIDLKKRVISNLTMYEIEGFIKKNPNCRLLLLRCGRDGTVNKVTFENETVHIEGEYLISYTKDGFKDVNERIGDLRNQYQSSLFLAENEDEFKTIIWLYSIRTIGLRKKIKSINKKIVSLEEELCDLLKGC